jgi:hypothetical protein
MRNRVISPSKTRVVSLRLGMCSPFVAALVLGACGDQGPRMSLPPAKFAIQIDSTASELSTSERQAAEASAVEQLVNRTPENHRSELRALLAKPNVAFDAATDAETARLFGIIMSMRTANYKATLAASVPSGSTTSAPPLSSAQMLARDSAVHSAVVVRVALVKHLASGDRNARAVVRRQPDDAGRPLILLPEKTATAGDLERAFRAAILSYDRYGPSPSAPVMIRLRHEPTARNSASARAIRALAYLQGSKVTNNAGVGAAQMLYVSVHR